MRSNLGIAALSLVLLAGPAFAEGPGLPGEDQNEAFAPEQTPAMARTQPLIHTDVGLSGMWGYGLGSYGLGAVVEPKFNITDQLSVGLRTEAGVLFGLGMDLEGSTRMSMSLGVNVGTQAKGEYHFTRGPLRPYVGLGAGFHWLVLQSVAVNSGAEVPVPAVYQGVGRYLSLTPQLGVDFGGTRLALSYNFIKGGDMVIQSVGGGEARMSRDYVTLELTWRGFSWSPPR